MGVHLPWSTYKDHFEENKYLYGAGIQSLGLQCLGKLAGADTLLSQVVVSCGVLDSIIVSLNHEHAPVQAAANNVLASVSGSTTEYAHKVLTAGAPCDLHARMVHGLWHAVSPCTCCQHVATAAAVKSNVHLTLKQVHCNVHVGEVRLCTPATGVMPHLIRQLQSGTPQVKESAIGTLNSLIRSSPEHASLICDDTLMSLLISLLSVPVGDLFANVHHLSVQVAVCHSSVVPHDCS